jgi:integrase
MSKLVTGGVRQLPSGRWQARAFIDGKHKSFGSFATERQAKAKAAQVQTDVARAEFFDEKKGDVLFRDHAAKVMEVRRMTLTHGTYRNGLGQLNNHLNPEFGHLPLNKITKMHVQLWWASMSERPSVRFQTYNVLRSVMKLAVEWELIRVSPCTIKAAAKDASKERPVFSLADFRKVLARTPEDFHVVAWTLFSAHPRIAELMALKRSDFDAEAGTLLIERQLQDGKITPTKTKSRRTIVVLEPGLSMLREYVKKNPMFPTTTLFRSGSGLPINEPYIRSIWNPAREAAGLPEMRIHDIRHVSLSFCGHSGMTLKEVMERAGHTTVDAALIYMGSDEQRRQEAASRTSQALLERISG